MSQCPEKTRLLDRKDECLDPQEQGVHEPDGIHPVQNQTPCGAHVRGGGQELVVAAVGVDDAAAARGHVIEPAGIEGLEEDEDASRS